jgi:hypothetical protein
LWFMSRKQLAQWRDVTYEDSLFSNDPSTSRSPKLTFPFTSWTKSFYTFVISFYKPRIRYPA